MEAAACLARVTVPGRTDDFRKLAHKLYIVATDLDSGKSVPFGAQGTRMTTAGAGPIGLTGGCQCGAVRYRLDTAPGGNICHCRMCQKASGGPFMAFGGVPNAFVVTRGALSIFKSSDIAERGFCAACGTPLTYRVLGGQRVGVTLGSLDHPDAVAPEEQFGAISRLLARRRVGRAGILIVRLAQEQADRLGRQSPSPRSRNLSAGIHQNGVEGRPRRHSPLKLILSRRSASFAHGDFAGSRSRSGPHSGGIRPTISQTHA